MTLFLVYVKDTRDAITSEVSKDIASYRIANTKTPLTGFQREQTKRELIGDQPAIWLICDDASEIESKIIESGFMSKIEFIQNYSKITG